MVRWVVLLAPIGVFALVLPLAAHGGAGVAGAVGFYVAINRRVPDCDLVDRIEVTTTSTWTIAGGTFGRQGASLARPVDCQQLYL